MNGCMSGLRDQCLCQNLKAITLGTSHLHLRFSPVDFGFSIESSIRSCPSMTHLLAKCLMLDAIPVRLDCSLYKIAPKTLASLDFEDLNLLPEACTRCQIGVGLGPPCMATGILMVMCGFSCFGFQIPPCAFDCSSVKDSDFVHEQLCAGPGHSRVCAWPVKVVVEYTQNHYCFMCLRAGKRDAGLKHVFMDFRSHK